MTVDRNSLLYRGSDGQLLSIDVKLEYTGGTIKVKPVSWGYWLGIVSRIESCKNLAEEQQIDAEMIDECLVEPKLTREEVLSLPPFATQEIINAILLASGRKHKEVIESTVSEDDLKKKGM